MNVEIGAEAALFPEKEYINGIAIAVWRVRSQQLLKYCNTAKIAWYFDKKKHPALIGDADRIRCAKNKTF